MSTTTPPAAMPDGEHAIDLPNPLDPEAPWVTYGTYSSWAGALRVARHLFGADDLGRISLITTLPVDDESDDSDALPTETPRLPVYRDRARRGVLERTIVRRDRLLAFLRCSAAPKTAADIVVALRRHADERDYNYSLAVKDLNALEAAELTRFVGHPRRWCATSQQAMTAADAAAWS